MLIQSNKLNFVWLSVEMHWRNSAKMSAASSLFLSIDSLWDDCISQLTRLSDEIRACHVDQNINERKRNSTHWETKTAQFELRWDFFSKQYRFLMTFFCLHIVYVVSCSKIKITGDNSFMSLNDVMENGGYNQSDRPLKAWSR